MTTLQAAPLINPNAYRKDIDWASVFRSQRESLEQKKAQELQEKEAKKKKKRDEQMNAANMLLSAAMAYVTAGASLTAGPLLAAGGAALTAPRGQDFKPLESGIQGFAQGTMNSALQSVGPQQAGLLEQGGELISNAVRPENLQTTVGYAKSMISPEGGLQAISELGTRETAKIAKKEDAATKAKELADKRAQEVEDAKTLAENKLTEIAKQHENAKALKEIEAKNAKELKQTPSGEKTDNPDVSVEQGLTMENIVDEQAVVLEKEIRDTYTKLIEDTNQSVLTQGKSGGVQKALSYLPWNDKEAIKLKQIGKGLDQVLDEEVVANKVIDKLKKWKMAVANDANTGEKEKKAAIALINKKISEYKKKTK
jgi:hypothetical protein